MSASDGIEEIGSGTHQRIVIDLRSFNERLAKKGSLCVPKTSNPTIVVMKSAKDGA